MNTSTVVVGILMVAILVPVVGYVTAKLVAFGYLRGRQLFEEFMKEKKDNGEDTKTT